MNKNIKKVIAIILAVGAFSTLAPVTNLNLMITKAYASSSSDTRLRSIYLSDGSIDFSSTDYSYTVNVSSSVDEIRITAKPENTDSTVEIDGTTVNESDDNYRDTVSLDYGENKIKIKVTDQDDNTRTYTLTVNRGSSSSYDNIYLDNLYLSDGDINFNKDDTSYNVDVKSSVNKIEITARPKSSHDDVTIDGSIVDDEDDYKKTVSLDEGNNVIKIKVTDEYNNDTRTYTLNVNRGDSVSNQDDIYLDSLSVDGTSVDLSNSKITYDVNVKESTDEVDIKAEPEHSDYDVTINGNTVDDGDNYKRSVSLDKGKNEITIKVKHDDTDEVRTYTLNITRGTTEVATNVKASQWVNVNGKVQYNDALGNPIKNSWFWDKATAKYYYLDVNGYISTGWLYNNSNWYLLDSTGSMLKGWQYTGGAWYYLSESGAMLYNTKVDGYKLGSNGAWIK